MTTYQLGAPMEWEAFRTMPNDLKEQYVRGLYEKYRISRAELAKAFGVCDVTLRKALADCSLADLFSAGNKMKQAERERFHTFWSGQEQGTAPVSQEPPAQEPADSSGEATGSLAAFAMRAFEFQFAGPYQADQLANSLRRMIPEGTRVAISIRCTLDPDQ